MGDQGSTLIGLLELQQDLCNPGSTRVGLLELQQGLRGKLHPHQNTT